VFGKQTVNKNEIMTMYEEVYRAVFKRCCCRETIHRCEIE